MVDAADLDLMAHADSAEDIWAQAMRGGLQIAV